MNWDFPEQILSTGNFMSIYPLDNFKIGRKCHRTKKNMSLWPTLNEKMGRRFFFFVFEPFEPCRLLTKIIAVVLTKHVCLKRKLISNQNGLPGNDSIKRQHFHYIQTAFYNRIKCAAQLHCMRFQSQWLHSVYGRHPLYIYTQKQIRAI